MSETKTTSAWDVRYVPDYVQKTISGGKGGKNGRPFLLDVRTFKINTKESGTKIGTYLLFGGVPPKELHEKLESVGFKIRRRPRWYVNRKTEKTVFITDDDKECYAVYYSTSDSPTDEQASLIAALLCKALNVTKASGKTFLLPTWEAVGTSYGSKDTWVSICSVKPEEGKEASAPEEDGAYEPVELPSGLF
jgi:hypothetical protein